MDIMIVLHIIMYAMLGFVYNKLKNNYLGIGSASYTFFFTSYTLLL